MKKIFLLLVILQILGCQTTTEQPCKYVLNEKEEFIKVCR